MCGLRLTLKLYTQVCACSCLKKHPKISYLTENAFRLPSQLHVCTHILTSEAEQYQNMHLNSHWKYLTAQKGARRHLVTQQVT